MTATDSTPTLEPAAPEAPARGSLKPVLDVIPPEAYENPTWKGLAYLARDLVLYALVVAGLILVDNPIAVVALWVLSGLVISGLFVIAHDAAHGALFASKRMNRVVGTIAMLPAWHVYEGWVLGHNRIHHAYTVREGYDFVWHPYTPEQYAAMSPLGRLRHRIEWSWLGAGAYYLREVWWHKMIVGAPPKRWAAAVRRDRILVWSFVALATLALGALGWAMDGTVVGAVWMVVKVLVVPFLAFTYVIATFVHVHHIQPDIRWYRRREWTKFKGQMEGTTVLRARFGLNFFFHWIMVHVPHHVDMRIPMYNLELATAAIDEAFPGTVHDEPLRFRDFVANTRKCRLYDFDEGRWFTYRQAREHLAAAPPTQAEQPTSAGLATAPGA
ncbi:fatty acid desaturase [Rhabdothermincola salaria]|uniref:fatty acid desaturase n=1 Tax=Rhabdothermincola salaria TaxID=2903142 RepID=UPI001E5FA4B4|nr:fatty acid desaturase [Rhabdothermincola salaria]